MKDKWNVIESDVSPDFSDVGQLSKDQLVAFENWVNTAINMLNRGKTDAEVLAKLSYDGCPNATAVLHRAKMQPEAEPDDLEFAEDQGQPSGDIYTPDEDMTGLIARKASEGDVFELLDRNGNVIDVLRVEAWRYDSVIAVNSKGKRGPVPKATWQGALDVGSLRPQVSEKQKQLDDAENERLDTTTTPWHPPTEDTPEDIENMVRNARVKVADGHFGTVMGPYEEYGQKLVRITMDSGEVIDIDPSQVEEIEDTDENPTVSEIQKFINEIPPVQPNQPSVEARRKDWKAVQDRCRMEASNTDDLSLRQSFASLELLAADALERLSGETPIHAHEETYLSEQPQYEVRVASRASEFTGGTDEGGDIWMAEQAALAEREASQVSDIPWRERAAVWISDLSDDLMSDATLVKEAAADHCKRIAGTVVPEFLREVEALRASRNDKVVERTPKIAQIVRSDAPDESIFL